MRGFVVGAALALVCTQGSLASDTQKAKVYLDEGSYLTAIAEQRLHRSWFSLSATALRQADQVYGDLKGDKSLHRELTFFHTKTGLPISFGLTKLGEQHRSEFAFKDIELGGRQGALSLGGSKDDDFNVYFRSPHFDIENAYHHVYGIALSLSGNENANHEGITVLDLTGAVMARFQLADYVQGTGQVNFLGVVSTVPMGEIVFDEDEQQLEQVYLTGFIFGTREAHILDDASEGLRVLFWLLFNLFVVAMLLVDFFCMNRGAPGRVVALKSALLWSLFWVFLAFWFAAFVGMWYGSQPALIWVTSYLLEKFLSVDNLFVFLTIFNSFKTPLQHQYKVLMWGIIGAIVLRTIFILTGVIIVEKFTWVIVLFGIFLIYTGIKLAKVEDDDSIDTRDVLQNNIALRILRKFVPITSHYDPNGAFFVRTDQSNGASNGVGKEDGHIDMGLPSNGGSQGGKWAATPLFVVLLVIETTDMVFAVDSIPAILSITTDPFIAYTSNIFAILGLRALYFCLAAAMHMFHYLPYALAFILVFIGAKMLGVFAFGLHIPVELALMVVIASLAVAVVASLRHGKKKTGMLPM